ncbi:MAG: hypothetical protein J0L94_09910 [Rhodothermia bacterium]|nr:hypothetical protein [Rhodothermia bacterium]
MNNFSTNNYSSYTKDDFLTYAFCPIRGEIGLPAYKPEEKVRLSLIWFLTNSSEIYPELVEIWVENDRYDISIYNKTIDDLKDYQPPCCIIETKREEFNLIDAYYQLIDYMQISKVENGILFNINQAFKVVKTQDKYQYTELFEPNEIIDFIKNSVELQKVQLENEQSTYLRAKNGDFHSFKVLALKYRRNKRVFFKIQRNNLEYIIEGHLFDFEEDHFKYTKCGYDTKSENKPKILNNEFVNMEVIRRQ